MRTTRGFVAITGDNKYLYIYSHKNGLVEVSTVTDIYDATVRARPGARDGKEAQQIMKYNVTWVPITIETKYIPGAL